MSKKVEVTTNEARQATTRPRTMIWVLWGSLFPCVMAGLGLAMGWLSLKPDGMALPQQHGSFRFQATPERSRPLTENAESPGEEINTEALHL